MEAYTPVVASICSLAPYGQKGLLPHAIAGVGKPDHECWASDVSMPDDQAEPTLEHAILFSMQRTANDTDKVTAPWLAEREIRASPAMALTRAPTELAELPPS
jgi:hypothetical protein